ncbi:SMODS domain-containing nucleotidyltransferase [Glycomyces dulcitolivorans]|uniref:SMODS domain-containing nucleotidyltransferase n=1 Tax=Glycomyces dulcitolivorans TaxID=2200759 RepID=UPI000DD4D122|nr:nucleotidyltransferase domain-containing protein [Glycomyces dulcitolivorans]
MNVTDAFRAFQSTVNVDMDEVKEARRRRDLFKEAFDAEPDVVEVVPSGSLARGTHKDPIHDVDVVLVFDSDLHPGWGKPGASAEDALDYTRDRINKLLGATNGSHEQVVRLARWRNHAVKCFFDDKDDPDAFTVDAMPALRGDGGLLVPEALSEDWILCDPESLIAKVSAKHKEWNKFAGSVRMLKWWASEQRMKIKSLVMEVLALQHLPTEGSQAAAIKEFFVSAAYFIEGGSEVVDPAGLCGPIQTDLDYETFADRLRTAGDRAALAVQAQADGHSAYAVRKWGEVFGSAFPQLPESDGHSTAAAAATAPRPLRDTPQG